MNQIALEILIILLLLLANGVFAMTEMAMVSARKTQLKQRAAEGDTGAVAALALVESPNRMLSTVQVGITLVGVLAGAFGGATLARAIAAALAEMPVLAPYAPALGIAAVVVGITYLSLILGELVPKRIALGAPERIASRMARPMNFIATIASPVVRFLGWSTDLVLALLGVKPQPAPRVSEEEIKMLMLEGTSSGDFHSAEPEMVEAVLALDRLSVREIMTPRPKIIFLNKDDPHEAVWHKIVVSSHSSFPVYQGNRDHVVGLVTVKAIYANLAANAQVRLAELMMPPLFVPETQPVVQLLETFRSARRHIALVADEFGSVVGLVTLVDVLEAIVGDFPTAEERLKPEVRRRDDGTWLIDGLIEVEEVATQIPDLVFPPEGERDYATLAGFVLTQLGRVPQEGETCVHGGFTFEVLDMDRQRVDKLLVSRNPSPVAQKEKV